MPILALKYSLFVFLAVCALLQLAAIRNNLKGLLFFKNRSLTTGLSIVVLIGVAACFFTWNYFNAIGVIEGSQQAGFFALSASLAILVTLFASSWINRSLNLQVKTPKSGLPALENATFLQLLRNTWVKKSK